MWQHLLPLMCCVGVYAELHFFVCLVCVGKDDSKSISMEEN